MNFIKKKIVCDSYVLQNATVFYLMTFEQICLKKQVLSPGLFRNIEWLVMALSLYCHK